MLSLPANAKIYLCTVGVKGGIGLRASDTGVLQRSLQTSMGSKSSQYPPRIAFHFHSRQPGQ